MYVLTTVLVLIVVFKVHSGYYYTKILYQLNQTKLWSSCVKGVTTDKQIDRDFG